MGKKTAYLLTLFNVFARSDESSFYLESSNNAFFIFKSLIKEKCAVSGLVMWVIKKPEVNSGF